jgi:hypothetical protein
MSERTVLECHGTPSDPCSNPELVDKFHLLAGSRLSPDAVSDLARCVDEIATLPVRMLTKPLRIGSTVLRSDRKAVGS